MGSPLWLLSFRHSSFCIDKFKFRKYTISVTSIWHSFNESDRSRTRFVIVINLNQICTNRLLFIIYFFTISCVRASGERERRAGEMLFRSIFDVLFVSSVSCAAEAFSVGARRRRHLRFASSHLTPSRAIVSDVESIRSGTRNRDIHFGSVCARRTSADRGNGMKMIRE